MAIEVTIVLRVATSADVPLVEDIESAFDCDVVELEEEEV